LKKVTNRGGEWSFKKSGSRKILVEFQGSHHLVFWADFKVSESRIFHNAVLKSHFLKYICYKKSISILSGEMWMVKMDNSRAHILEISNVSVSQFKKWESLGLTKKNDSLAVSKSLDCTIRHIYWCSQSAYPVFVFVCRHLLVVPHHSLGQPCHSQQALETQQNTIENNYKSPVCQHSDEDLPIILQFCVTSIPHMIVQFDNRLICTLQSSALDNI